MTDAVNVTILPSGNLSVNVDPVGKSDKMAQLAQDWAEKETPPAGPDTMSSRTGAEVSVFAALAAKEFMEEAEDYAGSYDAQALADAVEITTRDRLQTGLDRKQTGLDAGSAAGSAQTASLAAQAVGAQFFSSLVAGESRTSDGDVFLVQNEPGTAVFENISGNGVFLGWLGELLFYDVPTALASTQTGFETGQILRTRKEGAAFEVADPATPIVDGYPLLTAGEVKLRVLSVNNALSFGPNADGITDDTAAFKIIEAAGTGPVDLGGRSYALTSYGQDTSDGIQLKRDYRNGTLLMDGREIVFDSVEGAARSASAAPRLLTPSTTKKLALTQIDSDNFEIWRPLGGKNWAHYYLGRSTSGIPFNWEQTWLEQLLAFKTAEESGVTYASTVPNWQSGEAVTAGDTRYNDGIVYSATTSGTTGGTPPTHLSGSVSDGGVDWEWDRTADLKISSGSATLYVNGRARRINDIGGSVEITFTGGGDLYVIFYARSDSGHIGVALDGGTEYLALPDDGSGNKYFDAYSVPSEPKKIVKVASGVPDGVHTIVLSSLPGKNAASSGNRLWFNAIGWDGDATGPWLQSTDAATWTTGEAVLENEWRKYGGNYYIADVAGTTGATAPTHTSGSISDGGVTWTYRTFTREYSSYGLPRQRLQGAGSQLEYAYQIKPAGATTKEDVGGAAHGNEAQTSYSWYSDSGLISPVEGGWLIGNSFTIKEVIEATHSEIGGGSTVVVDTVLRRSFAAPFVEVGHRHTLNMAMEVGWFYAALWALLHYNSASGAYKFSLKEMWSPCDGSRFASDYYYDAMAPTYEDDSTGMTKDYVQVGYGPAYVPDGTLGYPGDGPTGLQFAAWLQVDGSGVENWNGNSRTFCSKSMNMSNKNPNDDPASSMICKMYFMRHDGVEPTSYEAGDVIECKARYGLAVEVV
ncbi:hypothetical protein [Sulfitobacter sp. R18_1]|uniref:hypothetical protein n=1 Tax=Sulfitobacter sp. R18_1 TaxID=2821104 RepID=UPI001AD998DB|nr:hypothetical protein [Sulfitobacter sp. R18_1]MBO9431601.1 hypothetical protein [Sulfitobacter sp. R18_1]